MKFKVKGSDFNRILTTTIKGYDNKEDNSYIAFEIDEEEGKLIVTSRSRAAFFEGRLPALNIELSPDEPRVYHLDGVKLKQLISILPNAPVDIIFEINDKTRSFTIKTIVSKYKLPVLSETPLAPTPVVKEYVTVDAVEFSNTIKSLIKMVSTSPSAQEHQVSCMHFNLTDDKVTSVATDGYALGVISIDSSKDQLEDVLDVLIRHTEINTLLDNFVQGETLTLVGSDEMFGYIDESGTLSLVGRVNLPPMDTSQFKNTIQDDVVVEVDKGELKAAIETVAKLSPQDDTVDIEMDVSSDSVRVGNRSGDYIDVRLKSPVQANGKVSFATGVILNVINPANTGELKIQLGDISEGSAGAARIASLNPDGSIEEEKLLIAVRMAG